MISQTLPTCTESVITIKTVSPHAALLINGVKKKHTPSTRKPRRSKGSSMMPPPGLLYLDLWPPDPRSWRFHALATWTTCVQYAEKSVYENVVFISTVTVERAAKSIMTPVSLEWRSSTLAENFFHGFVKIKQSVTCQKLDRSCNSSSSFTREAKAILDGCRKNSLALR